MKIFGVRNDEVRNYLIFVCITCVGILAYVLECVDNEWWKYGVVSAAVFLILLLMIDVVLLVQQIIDYYSPKDLLGMLLTSSLKNINFTIG